MSGSQTFDAKRGTHFLLAPEEVVVIGLDTSNGPEHPLWDERIKMPLQEEMIVSIMRQGVHTPIRVRKNGDKAEVVAGRRRVIHAREANRRLREQGKPPVSIPALVDRGEDLEQAGRALEENELRAGDPLMVKAQKAQRYLNMGGSIDDAAIHFGVSKTALQNWLALLDVDTSVKKAVAKGEISESAASKLARLSREEQKDALEQMVAEGKTTTAGAQAAVKKAKEKREDEPRAALSTAPGKRLLKKLLKAYDAGQVELPKEFIDGMAFAIGELEATEVEGMVEILEKLK